MKQMAKLKLYPVSFEVYIEGDSELQAKFNTFDSESLSVEINDKIMSPEQLHEIADLFEIAWSKLEKGYSKNER